MSFDAARVAEHLHATRAARTPAGPLPAGTAPATIAEGIAAQHALARRWGAIPPAGFKIGATTTWMQGYLGLPGPAAGFMRADAIHRGPAVLAWANYRNPGVECEIAVRLAHDLPPGPCTPEQAAAAVGEVCAAIEIVENRYGPPPMGDLKAVGTPTLIADQVFHAACVLAAPPANWRAMDLGAVQGRFLIDGVEKASGHGRDLLGHPMQALAWLAASAEVAAFGGLRAGQVVMLGSVTPPLWLDAPCTVTALFDGFAPAEIRFV